MTYPIPEHETWYIRDPSKVSTFMDCARWYFFNYILGWQSTAINADTLFGECWHIGMEFLLLNDYSEEAVIEAHRLATGRYRQEIAETQDEIYFPKTPASILLGLAEYTQEYKDDHDKIKVLYTEIAGSVPIDEGKRLYFRMDSIIEHLEWEKKYFSWDHKSTGRSFSRMWRDAHQLSFQNGTYTHALYCLFPIHEVRGLEFSGTCFLKTKRNFERCPAWKNPRQMQVWLWQALDIWSQMDYEMERLSKCTDSDEVMEAFPMNTNNCTKFRGCPYHDFCCTWSNPLQHAHNPPLGYEVDFWDPRKKPATHTMELEWKGGEE